jgi:hypothetical protein
MKRVVLVLLVLVFAVPGLAVDIPTPAGFMPWFSVDLEWLAPEVVVQPSTDTLTPGTAVSVVVVASNPAQASVPSDASPEQLILPVGVNPPIPGWPGATLTKLAGRIPGVKVPKGTGAPTRCTVFRKDRVVYGACGKPGVPGLVP